MREHRRHLRNYSMYFAPVALIVIIIFTALSLTVFFRVKTVNISGKSVYSAAAVAEASGINGGDNLIRTNLKKSSQKIESELVYIEKAALKRNFPSSVDIEITPCVETASVEFEGKFYLLSQSGKILKMIDEPMAGTVIIYGAEPVKEKNEEESEEDGEKEGKGGEEPDYMPVIGEKLVCREDNRTEILYRLIEVAGTAMQGKLRGFDMTDHLNISSVYDNRIKIEFGSIGEFDYKLRLAASIITTKIGPDTEGTLTMLSNGASFIDKEGLAQNEQTYLDNISAPPLIAADDTNEDGGGAVHFE